MGKNEGYNSRGKPPMITEVIHRDAEEVHVKITGELQGSILFRIDTEEWDRLHAVYENIIFSFRINDRRKNKRYNMKPYVMAIHGPYGHSPSQRIRQMFLHRLILDVPKGMVVDHISGDSLDNRKSNLRVCTNAQNSRNNTLIATSTTGFKGVQSTAKNGTRLPWRARIKYNYKEIPLGRFVTQEEAALAYDECAKQLFEEYASLNYPDGPPPEVLEHIQKANAHYKANTRIGRGASKYRGVIAIPNAKSRPWKALFKHNGQRYYLGTFATEEEAAHAYDAKALEVLGPTGQYKFGESSFNFL